MRAERRNTEPALWALGATERFKTQHRESSGEQGSLGGKRNWLPMIKVGSQEDMETRVHPLAHPLASGSLILNSTSDVTFVRLSL